MKATMEFIYFEMRMSNNEKVKDLYFKAFEKSLIHKDAKQVTHLCMKYARFLAFKCNDVQRACDVMEKATSMIKSEKVLYLS
jgi:deoxyhypusine synthase